MRYPHGKVNKIRKNFGLKCDLSVKCEFFDVSRGVKDSPSTCTWSRRPSWLGSEAWLIIEPMSWNTRTRLALAAAVKGYHYNIIMLEKMSMKKWVVLWAWGLRS